VKKLLIISAAVLVAVYVAISLGAFFDGLIDSVEERYSVVLNEYILSGDCLDRPARAEAYFPTYKLGCWLGGATGRDYYWESPRE
jgi:hypothetical protein